MFGFEWNDLVWIVPTGSVIALTSLLIGIGAAAAWDRAANRRRDRHRCVIAPEILRGLGSPVPPAVPTGPRTPATSPGPETATQAAGRTGPVCSR